MKERTLVPIDLDSDSTDSETRKYHVNAQDDLNHKVKTVKGRERRPLALTEYDEYEEEEQGSGGIAWKMLVNIFRVIISNAVSVSSIFMGVIYLGSENCPAEPLLTTVLIFSGILGVFLSAMEGCGWAKTKLGPPDEDPEMCFGCKVLSALLTLLKIGLFIYFTVLVFLLWFKNKVGQCDPTLFYYSVAQIGVVVFYLFLFFFRQTCVVLSQAKTKLFKV